MAAALSGAATALRAQSPDWSSVMTIPAFPSPYLSDWERVPSTGLLSVTYSGAAATDFVVRVTLTSTERGLVGTTESPSTSLAGGPVTLLFNARDAAVEWDTKAKNRAITDQVFRTGQIPEGRYRACATVLQGTARTAVTEACADFTILLPDPPQLVTPAPGAEIRTAQPFFSWTPVNAPPDVGLGYRLRIVEVIGTQAPGAALAANIPLLDQVVLDAPFLLYPLDGVQFEPGKRYAWQVVATSADGQQLFRDKVASEIQVFTMAGDLLGPLGTVAELGDTAIVQPGVAVLRGLRGARVRADVALGAYTVDGALTLELPGLPGRPALPVQVSGLQVARRGEDAWLVGGTVRVSKPRGLLPQGVGALASIRELVANPRTGVTATVQVGIPGQGTLALDGSFVLTALGWYGRREGASTAADGFARVGRAQFRLALRRARLDLPSGALEVGGAVRLLGSAAGCDDVWTRADDGVVRAILTCRGTGAFPLGAPSPSDFLVEMMAGRFTADILADTVGYELAVGGRARLFGPNGPACHVQAALRLVPDSVTVVGQQTACRPEDAVQKVAPWLALRYEILRLDSLAVRPDSSLAFVLGFQARPELTRNPAFPMPAFVNAYATRDSIVLPALPDLLEPDAPGVLDQFRLVWRRAATDRIAKGWRDWKPDDPSPYAWRLEGDGFFDPDMTGLQPCLSMRFRLAADTARIRIAGGHVRWTTKPAKYDDGCDVGIAPGLRFTAYRMQGTVDLDLADPTKTRYPEVVGVLEDPTWPPPAGQASAPVDTVAAGGNAVTQWFAGAFETVKDVATGVVATVMQAKRTAFGAYINSVTDGGGVCNVIRLPIDGRGRLIGEATVKKGCDVTLGIGKMTPYAGKYAFGAVTPHGQEVRWIGGVRIGLDSTLKEFDDAVKKAQDSTAKALVADSTAKAKAAADSIAKADAADPAKAAAAAVQDSLKFVADSIVEAFKDAHPLTAQMAALSDSWTALNDSVKVLRDSAGTLILAGKASDSPEVKAIYAITTGLGERQREVEARKDSLERRRDSLATAYATRVRDSLGIKPPATLASAEPAKAAADTAKAAVTDSTKAATDSTKGGVASAASAAGDQTTQDLKPPGPQEADSPDSEIDWLTGRVIRGKWTVKGPFVVMPIPGLAFRLRNAVIDSLGLKVDGSFPVLYMKSADSSMTQWAGVRLNLGSKRLDAGVVTFSQGFAMEMGTADTISGAGVAKDTTFFGKQVEIVKVIAKVVGLAMQVNKWQVRPLGAPKAFVNGVRADVAQAPILDGRGLGLRGASPIASELFGSSGPAATLRYSNDFFLRNWTTVSQGSATLEIGGTPIAVWTPAGWRPAVAELVAARLPKRLPLPTEAVAYVQLRDSVTDALLVNVAEEGTNWRLSTPLGPAKLVVPGLAAALGGKAPSANVSFDLLVDKATFALQSGSIVASVKGVPGFDLAAGGIPFALDTLRYDRDAAAGGGYRLSFGAALALIGEGTPTGRVRFSIDGSGNVSGTASLPVARALDLGTPQVQLLVDGLSGSIAGNVATGLDYRIDATGGLRLALEGQQPWTLGATLRLTPGNAQFVDVRQDMAGMLRLGTPGAALLFGNPRLPLLAFDPATKRVRFDLLFDLGVEVPALAGVKIPAIRDIHVRETGIDIPAFEISDISSQMLADGTFGAQPQRIEAAGFSVRPLALRVGAVNWTFGAAPNVDVRLDVELGLTAPAGPPPDDLSSFKVRVLDLGWRDGALRGTVEPVRWASGLRTPFGSLTSAWGSFAVGARSEAHIYVGADVRLPDLFGCGATASFAPAPFGGTAPKDTLEFLPSGQVRGTIANFVPQCGGALGPIAFGILDSRVRFDAGPNQRPSVVLDGTARVAVATGVANDSVRADGRLAIDLVTGEVTDANIAITQPFVWQPDPRNPIVAFRVNRAQLTRTALTFTGGGDLRLVGGATAGVQFDSLAWSFRDRKLVSGSATVTASVALGAEIGDAGLVWGAFPANTPLSGNAGFRLTLPAGVRIDAQGIGISGTATATLAFGDSSFASLSTAFENGFRLATTGPVRVLSGQAVFRRGSAETIATVDSTGFRPGDLFAVLPIPDRLGLPTQDVAYLVLGDATRRFVELAPDAQGRTHLRTPSGKTVDLFLPALAYGGPVPKVTTAFDLIIEPRTMKIVGGLLQVDAAAGQSLVPLPNLPVDLTRLGFSLTPEAGWQLRAGARVRLPASLTQAPIEFRDIMVDRTGLAGTVQVGTLTDRYTPGLAPVLEASLLGDSLRLGITAAKLDLAPGRAPTVAIAGIVSSAVLRNAQGVPAPLFLRGTVGPQSFEASADLSGLGSDGIPLGVATLRPTTPNGGAPLRFVADARRTALEFGASVELTGVAPGLVVAIDTVHIGSDGLRVSPLSITGGNAVQFTLFGLTFALQDSTDGGTRVYPALAGTFDGAALRLEMSGRVTIMENTTRFYGLRVGTDGTLALAGVSLISRPIPIVQDRLSLDTLRIDQGTLRASASVMLPAPFDVGAAQRVGLVVSPDGRVTGNGTVVLIAEDEGLATAQKKIDLNIATFHVRYLAATLDFERPRERTSIDLVSDIYLQNKEANLVRLGSVSGNTVQAGLRVSLSGVSWSGLQVVRPIVVDIGPVRLTLSSLTAVNSPRGLSASFSGGLGLALEAASGGVTFRDVLLTEQGQISLAQARFDGGSIRITDKFSLDVRNLGFSDTETVIDVPGDNRRPTSGTASVPPVQSVRVSSYLSFGASVTIMDVFSGGVKRILVYRRADDQTNHILVDSLYAKVSDVFEVTASMKFDEYTDGFAMQVAGRALLMKDYGVALVGVLSSRANVVRAGLFLAAYVDIPIIPGVFGLTGVGGGFFINPEPGDLDLVRTTAGITGGPAQRMGSPPASAFAILLYARAVGFGQGDAAAVAGQVLVTVTDKAFRLDGNMVFLGRKNELTADVALQVGWAPSTYLLGDFELNVKFDSAATGKVNVLLAIGGNAFAIKGKGSLSALSVLTVEADVVLVPSGFATGVKVSLNRTFWVVQVNASLTGQIWFRPATNDLGAYVEIRGGAGIPGIAGIEAYLRGALIVLPKFALYAGGGGRAYLLGESVEVQFWLSISADGFGAGLGENAEMNAAIERARQVATELKAEADSIIRAVQNGVSSLSVSPVVASPEVLGRVFENAKGWASGNWAATVILGLAVANEATAAAGVDRTPYFGTYWRYLTQASAPSDTAAIAALRAEAEQKLAILAARRDEMLARIATLQASVDSVRSLVMPALPNPVRRFAVGDPQVAAAAGGTGGGARTPATVTGLPEFDLDDAVAAQNKVTMTALQQQAAARQAEVARALGQAQAALDSVRSALSATQSSGLMGYLRLWADAVEATERQQATMVDYQMRRWNWVRQGLTFVRSNRAAFRETVTGVSNAIASSAIGAGAKVARFDSVSAVRAQLIGGFGRDPNFYPSYQAARAAIGQLGLDQQVAAMKLQADTLAMQLYSQAAEVGLAALDTVLPREVQATAATATAAVQRVRAAHAEITGRTAQVSDAQVELYGAVYDLYDAMLRELPDGDTLAVRIKARRDAIAPLLTAPQIGSAQATVQDFGFMSKATITFSATHPAGVPEYTIVEGDNLTRSLGPAGTYTTWRWTTELAGGAVPFSAQMGARAAGGTRTTRGTPALSLTFAQGTPAAPASASVSALATDVTLPSVPAVTAPGGFTTLAGDGTRMLWVTKGQQAALAWSATDLESGIQEYRYRVVERDPPSASATLVLSPLPRTALLTGPVELVPWTSLGGRTSMLLTPPTPAAGKVAQFEIVARNGAGLTGSTGSLVLVQDPTAPAIPAGTQLSVAGTGTRAAAGVAAAAVGPLCGITSGTVPAKALLTVASPLPTQTGVLYAAKPPVTDGESGIAGWYAAIDTVAPTTVDANGWVQLTDTAGTSLAIPGVPYERDFVVAVAARNGAGAFSGPVVTAGRVRLLDPSAPPAPGFCLTGDAGSVAVRVTTTVSDPQSGIRGYQLRLRTSAGAILRDWPANGAVDVPGTVTQGELVPLPNVPLPTGGSLLADLRAVNGGGTGGDQAASGTLLVDLTPPPAPTIVSVGRITTNRTGGYQFTITVSAQADPESGFGGIDVRLDDVAPFGTRNGTVTMVPWSAVASPATGSKTYVIGIPSLPVNTPTVYVRTRNGTGMPSTVVQALVPQ